MSSFKPVPEKPAESPAFTPRDAGFVPAPVEGQEEASWTSKLMREDAAGEIAIVLALALGVALVVLVVAKLFDGLTLGR